MPPVIAQAQVVTIYLTVIPQQTQFQAVGCQSNLSCYPLDQTFICLEDILDFFLCF